MEAFKLCRVRVVGALVVGLVLLAGCSAEQNAEPKAGASRASGAAEPALVPLAGAELKALTFKDGEVPQAYEGGMQVKIATEEDAESEFPPVSDPDCEETNEVRYGHRASAVVSQVFNWKNNIFPSSSTLASYSDGQAKVEFDRLKRALESCGSYDGEGYAGYYQARIEVKSAVEIGDESVTFLETIAPSDPEVDPRDRVEQFTVVRVGNVIATFQRYDLARTTPFPPDLIKKQTERLRKAQNHRRE